MSERALVYGVAAALAALSPGVVACGDSECDPTREACVFEKTVSTLTVPAGFEDEDTCQSWTLNNPTELWVTGIEQTNGGGYHHANWFHVPDDQFKLPDGTWSCSENDFQELTAAILGGYLFALSTQSLVEAQAIPAGGAIRIPPYSRIIGASHLLNASDSEVVTDMHVKLTTVAPDDVAASLAPARIEYNDLSIDAMGRSSFTTECHVADTYEDTMGEPFQYELYYVLSHYHELGYFAQLELAGGPRDGEVVFRHDGYGENFGQPIDPPLDVAAAGATGLRFTCGFDNPRNVPVGWGIGDQEMCVVALQARTNMGWQGNVRNGNSEASGTAPDGAAEYTGPCALLGVPWDHTKPGGSGN